MAVSVRLDPLMEKELELSAKRQGVTKSQFIIAALERALGRKDSYQLMQQAKAEIAKFPQAVEWEKVYASEGGALYDPEQSRQQLIEKLRAKHGLSAG